MISHRSRYVAVLVLATLVSGFAACASATPRGRVYVRVGPPAPIVETRVVSPGSAFVWVPGYYAWQRSSYVWVPGRWVRPPRARAVWVPARWVHNRRGWYVVQGRWR